MRILGTRIDNVDMRTALQKAEEGMRTPPFVIVTPNSEIVVKANSDAELMDIIENADMVVPDGIGLVIGSKIVKEPVKERVTGIDLMMNILSLANEEGYSIFLLGSKEEVVTKAAEKIKEQYKDIKVAGFHNGYYKGIQSNKLGDAEELAVVEKIKEAKPDIIFVAFGAPNQEKFIDIYKSELGAKLLMGVGGSFDVISGMVKRAPKAWQKMGLEWLYRLIKEPWRIKRAGALPVFAINVLLHKDKPMKK